MAETTDTITVQDTESVPVAPPPVESGWTSLIPMVLIFVVFYFLLIRPQEKRRREHENLVSGVKKGEEVMTNSGLFGIVTKINDSDSTVMVQVAKDVEVKVLKSSIANIVSRESKKVEQTANNKEVKQVKKK
ncbi:MAG: preprotein translocase subunit YajC [Rickettsiaceae bacterium]